MDESKNAIAKASVLNVERQRLVDALSEIVHEDNLGVWLQQPNNAFDGLTPVELIEQGQSDRLWEMIHNLRSGNPA